MNQPTYRQRLIALMVMWIDRAKAMGLKPGTVKYLDARVNFFLGALAWETTVDETASWPYLILISVGRKSNELLDELRQAEQTQKVGA